MLEDLRKDSARYKLLGGWLWHPGFWIIAIYRFGMWAHALSNPMLRVPMWVLYRVLHVPCRLFNVELWAGASGAKIGAGFCLIHPANVYIGPRVEIGENCKLFHEVTLGTGHIPGTPKLGNNVDVFVGARILGGVVIGDDSMVSANCVVTKNIAPRSVVMPAPNRIIPRSLSPKAREVDQEEV
jgi:serine O-acetyltransferase